MSSRIQIVMVCSLLLLSFMANSAGSVKDRLKALQGSQNLKDHEQAAIDAGKMINRLPRNMEGLWDRKQIATIVDLLLTEKDAVYRQQIIEATVVHFEDNRKAIGQYISANATIAAQDKKDLLYDIDAMINSKNRGQDPPRSKDN